MHEIAPPDARVAPAAPGLGRIAGLLIDLAERSLIVALYGWLAWRLISVHDGQLANFLLLASDGLVIVFMIARRPGPASVSPVDWLMALGATCLPLLVDSEPGRATIPTALGSIVVLMGIVIQVHAKVSLGRSFGCVPANRGLRLGGPYQIVRHPMYAGYLLVHLAFLAMNATPWNLAVYAASYALQVPRLLAEERILRGESPYRDYCDVVRYRLIPGIF